MSEETNNDTESSQVNELELLKNRARLMGVEFSNNIGLETLKERIKAKQSEETGLTTESTTDGKEPNPLAGDSNIQEASAAPVKKLTLRQHLFNENMKLVRIRITNMDPKKADLKGEFFTVANEYIGTVTKFIPYGEATEDGWHVPYCIFKMLRAKKFLQIKTFKNKKTGQQEITQAWVREFSIEVLDDLTEKELHQLAIEQAASGRIE